MLPPPPPKHRGLQAVLDDPKIQVRHLTPLCVLLNTYMTRRCSIPKGIYRCDCSSSPPRFKAGEQLTVVKKGPPGHCIVSSSTGIEAIIRNSEILLDAQWTMYQVQFPSESTVNVAAIMNDVNARGHLP